MTGPVYYCKACASPVTAEHESCPSCGANLKETGRLVEVRLSETIQVSSDHSFSTAVYAPPGTPPSEEQLGRMNRAVNAVAQELRGWEVEGFTIGIPPFVVRVGRGGRAKQPAEATGFHLGFWDTQEIRRRESSAELEARLTLHGRAIRRFLEGKLRPGESVDGEGKTPTSDFLGRIFWTPGRFRNRVPPISVAETPELVEEIERRLKEARRRN